MLCSLNAEEYDVTFEPLLLEMTDRNAVAQWPRHECKALLHGNYNRNTNTLGDPNSWFANGDRGFAILEEQSQRRTEMVMEHEGSGVLTRLRAAFFYWKSDNQIGEIIGIYLDGNPEVVSELHSLLYSYDPPKERPYGSKKNK